VLLAELHQIGAALPGVEGEGQCETGRRADWVSVLEFLDFVQRPRMEPVRIARQVFNAGCRIKREVKFKR